MAYKTSDKNYQRNKAAISTRQEFAVRRSNWVEGTNPPVCAIHDEQAIWHKNRARESGGQWACPICSRNKSKGLRRKWRTDHTNPLEYNIKKSYTLAKHHCKAINRDFSIPFASVMEMWNSQNGECAICCEPMEGIPGNNTRNPRKVTMDRIDSSKGYVVGNVHLVCEQCNRAKSNLTRDELIRFANGILRLFKYQ